ncbi:MAG: AI-2E family transporter [Alphaproteobacteria bacterium]|nr:AI-2E family transporter [Alphaproteobacteria bacterium]
MTARAYRLLFWIGALLVVCVALGLFRHILTPFAASFAIAYILDPAVTRLERWGLRRTAASLLVLIAFLFAVGLTVFLLVPLVQGQIVLLIARLPNLVAALQSQFGDLQKMLQQQLPAEDMDRLRELVGNWLGAAVTWLVGLFQSVITSSIAILNVISLVVVTPIVTFFLLRDWEVMVANIDAYLPREPLGTIREQSRIISDMLVGFVHGQALVCVILAVYYGTALSLAGIQSALALGLLIGVLAIVPVIGVATGFALSIGLAAMQETTWTSIFVVCGIFLFGQSVEANILTPKLVGDRIHLHPVWVIFALFAGGTLLGFVGVLIAVPAAAVIGVLVRFALLRYRRSAIYDPHQPEAVRGLTPYE